jgi:light-regulated signal transduction histidine kinase (bacteriophytochrome)
MTIRDLAAALRNQPPAEHEYDWAPIHMPGTIQSYGVLLVVNPQTRRVQFISNNVTDILGLTPSEILDKSYLNISDNEKERNFIKDRVGPETVLFPNPLRMTVRGREYDAIFHAHAGAHIIELEPVHTNTTSYDAMSLKATAELYDPPSVEDLYQRSVKIIRDVSGFDRVMLYRFDSRYNGQVIAECGRPDIGSFLGLFFPSSDIGARARALYLENFTRYIPDIAGAEVSLTGLYPGGGHADTGHPVDMSHTNLRSVVPCHVTYLRNIGVNASMSFSINVDDRLWGLFACHNYVPKLVSYDQRVVCEQTAMMFIYRLASMGSAAARLEQRQRGMVQLSTSIKIGAALRHRLGMIGRDWSGTPEEKTAESLIARAVEAVEAETSLLLPVDPSSMPAAAPPTAQQKLLLDLVEADSAAIVHHGYVTRIGDAPPAMAIYAIVSMFGRELPDLRTASPHVYATDGLTNVLPAAGDIKDRAAGFMAAALSLASPSYLIWFRREQIVHATWAGNPTADAMSAGSQGLNPRASFDAWKQDIRDLSRPWVIEDVQIAHELACVLRNLENAAATSDTVFTAQHPSAFSMGDSPVLQHLPSTPDRRVIRIGQR